MLGVAAAVAVGAAAVGVAALAFLSCRSLDVSAEDVF